MRQRRGFQVFWAVLVASCLVPKPALANLPAPITSDALGRDLALALAVTIIIEVVIALLLGVRGRALLVVAAMNVITNPLFNLVLVWVSRQSWGFHEALVFTLGTVVVCEIIVIVVEAYVLRRVPDLREWGAGRVIRLSAAINLGSWLLGLLLMSGMFGQAWVLWY